MTKDIKPTCGNCRYYVARDKGAGQCRRHPPQIVYVAILSERQSRFPTTKETDWCGEHSSNQLPPDVAGMERK